MSKSFNLGAAILLAGLGLAGWGSIHPPRAKAQTSHDFQIWNAVFFTGQALRQERGPTFWFDAHARRSSAGSVVILRPGVGYALSSWASIWVGYAWGPGFLDASSSRVDVQGVWEQATFTYRKGGRFTLQARTRFEQFWSDAGSGMFPRIRQFGRFNYRPSEDVPVGLALWDEVFFGLKSTDWADAGFFENRLFGGLAIFANKSVFRVEPGYMFLNVTQGSAKILSHVLVINFFIDFQPK